MENLNIEIFKANPKFLSFFIKNKDINFTEKIIVKDINILNLRYKIVIERLNEIESCIKTKYIPQFYNQLTEKEINYSPIDTLVNLEDIDDKFLYKLRVYLVEKLFNGNEDTHKVSNSLYLCTKYGLITEEIMDKLYRAKYKTKKIYSISEKDNMKAIQVEIRLKELEGMLDDKTIRNFTLENRNHKNIEEFTNSKSRYSKKMSDERVKKVLYSTNSRLFFDNKFNEQSKKNSDRGHKSPFLKNEWFMGPVYAYDENYINLFK